jgi:hypothetical protein
MSMRRLRAGTETPAEGPSPEANTQEAWSDSEPSSLCFNRGKYDSARTVEAFSVRLRDEVDRDALTAELLAVATRRARRGRRCCFGHRPKIRVAQLLKRVSPGLCRVKSRTADAARLVSGVSPGRCWSSASRSSPLVTAVVRWPMPRVCPKRPVQRIPYREATNPGPADRAALLRDRQVAGSTSSPAHGQRTCGPSLRRF